MRKPDAQYDEMLDALLNMTQVVENKPKCGAKGCVGRIEFVRGIAGSGDKKNADKRRKGTTARPGPGTRVRGRMEWGKEAVVAVTDKSTTRAMRSWCPGCRKGQQIQVSRQRFKPNIETLSQRLREVVCWAVIVGQGQRRMK